jgi:hypothetical protein
MTRARIVVAGARAFVLAFGVTSLWLTRDALNPDGIAYLDASDVYLAGGWPASGSGYWSPLYPTLLAVGRKIGGTSVAREQTIAQVVNVAISLLAFAALEWLIRAMRARTEQSAAPEPNDTTWRVLAYALFAWAMVGWIQPSFITPDLLVAAITLAIAACSVRLATGRGGSGSALLLGLLLALGYLAKAAMFPVGIVVLATLAFVRRRQRGVGRAAVAAIVFLGLSAPQIAYVSRLKGAPTFGDVGRLNYLWFVAGVPGPVSSSFALPATLPSHDGIGQRLTALDGNRREPAVFDVDAPIPGTLPIWYDAGYWYRGVAGAVAIKAIIRAAVRHTRVYFEMFGFLVVGGAAAALVSGTSRRDVFAMRPEPMLVVPALAALAMYGLVLVQSRYVAPFALLLFAGLVPPAATDELSRRLRTGFAAGAVLALPLVMHLVRVERLFWFNAARDRSAVVADLEAKGVPAGARLGYVGEAYDALWARAGRFRFVSVVPSAEADRFWALDEAARARIMTHMRNQGAVAVVAEAPVMGINIAGWEYLPPAGKPKPSLIVWTGVREP